MDKKRFLPEYREIIDLMPKLDMEASIEHVRQISVPSTLSDPPSVNFWDEYFDGAGTKLRMRFYKPKERADSELGLIYWTHGGGMYSGTPEMDDGLFEKFATEANVMIAAIDYRLAPENPYPIPMQDCYDGLLWLSENSERLGFNKNLVAIGGASAGGNLAIATAMMARDKNGPEIFFQMPLCPMLDFRLNIPSSYEITENLVPFSWNRKSNAIAWERYLKGTDMENVPCYASPALAVDLSGLPRTYISIGQLDPLRDENITFVQRLCQAEVDVEFHLYPGVAHGFELLGLPISILAQTEYVRVIKRVFNEQRNEIEEGYHV